MQHFYLHIALVALFCVSFSTPLCSKSPVVSTKYGPVVGSIQLSRQKRQYRSFQGIPYAKPPINGLRFAAPQPPEPWPVAINATKDAPFCIQKNYFFANPAVAGQEDCLYMNIYVPITESLDPLPVMVFIHWGDFFAGRGSSDYIGPEYLMDKDIILVSFNYRLGVFGFFSTLDDVVPGNMGLKDQVLALKFVQENIAAFGGNKDKVTLFGQSAGGGSVNLHLISPSSKGLFHQAISQSGVALDLWAKTLNALQPTVIAALSSFTDCSEYLTNNTNLVDCLRKIDANTLAETADKFKYFSIEPLTPYTLVTETETAANPDPFLTKDPLEYLQDSDFQKVPFIAGTVQDEGILRVSPLTRQPGTLKALNANFDSLLPQMMGLELSVGEDTKYLYNEIVNFYLGGKPFIDIDSPDSVQGFIDLYTDRSFAYGVFQTLILQSRKGQKPIWVYNFDYRGDYTYGDLWAATNNTINFNWGTSHCDDLLYLFRSPGLFPDLKHDTDLIMSEKLINIWTNFAIFGNPDPDKTLSWSSLNFNSVDDVKNENLRFLNISGSSQSKTITFKLEKGYFPERMNFWLNQKLAENFP